jgi:TatD DNase family protein
MPTAQPLPALSAGIEVIDSHCHLDEKRFDDDRQFVIERAQAAGVHRMITIGASDGIATNYAAVELAAQHAGVFATVGVHPHDAHIVTPEALDQIRTLARQPKVVAIGETGLDYYYDNSPRDVQRRVFRQLIELARGLGLPLSIHLRDAYDDAVRILREEKAADVGGVIHCFSGDRRVAREMLELDFDLSFSGVVTFKNAEELRAVAREVPADRFMVETDAPFLAPVPHRGRRNEPQWVLYTAACIAEIRGQSLDDTAAQASRNAARRFRLPAR